MSALVPFFLTKPRYLSVADKDGEEKAPASECAAV